MAYGTSFKFGTHYLQLGDGASSESFTTVCGVTEYTQNTNVQTNETLVPD